MKTLILLLIAVCASVASAESYSGSRAKAKYESFLVHGSEFDCEEGEFQNADSCFYVYNHEVRCYVRYFGIDSQKIANYTCTTR